MVDVSEKKPTVRTALTQCVVKMNQEAFQKLREGTLNKGDAISIAEIAGIMAAKQTSNLVSQSILVLLHANNYCCCCLDSTVPLDCSGFCESEL